MDFRQTEASLQQHKSGPVQAKFQQGREAPRSCPPTSERSPWPRSTHLTVARHEEVARQKGNTQSSATMLLMNFIVEVPGGMRAFDEPKDVESREEETGHPWNGSSSTQSAK